LLNRQPTGPVSIRVDADDETEIWNGTTYVDSIVLSWLAGEWEDTKLVRVRAVNDLEREALHFSRLTHTITSNLDDFLGVTLDDVARGLGAAIVGDVTGRFDAIVSGTTVTITGPAFTAEQITATPFGTLTIDAGASEKAFTGTLAVAVTGTITTGQSWTLILNGQSFTYLADVGDTATEVAEGLVAEVNDGAGFAATLGSGGSFTVVSESGRPYTAVLEGTGTVTGGESASHYSRLVLQLAGTGRIPAGARWSLKLNPGATQNTAVEYAYVAGANGESTQPKPMDVRVTDDDAPGVLVLETDGDTAVAEPSRFVVIGDGFVTRLLSSAGGLNGGWTRFEGDFGTSVLNEIEIHDGFYNAQDIDLGKWSAGPYPDIASVTGDSALEPHITIRATGNGDSDFYRFEITQDMIEDDTGTAGLQASFDIDRGFEPGDPILWLSLLKLYNASEDLLAQGPGWSHPSTGALGSSTWLDDYLAYTFTAPGTYYLEVTSWLLTTGLPVGVDYELQVSLEAHPVAGFVFSPSPVLENEQGNNELDAAQPIEAEDFFRFFDPEVGNMIFGGSLNFLTPYSRIQGSGDGTFDVYSFFISPEMLEPPAAADDPLTGTVEDESDFFTSVDLQLNGTVRSGDRWTLGLRYRDYQYVASAGDTLLTVANAFRTQLLAVGRYSVSVTGSASSATLHIEDEQGLNLRGVTVPDGIAQDAALRATITRTTAANDADGDPITFTSADVTLLGTVGLGESWILYVDGAEHEAIAGSATTLADIAAAWAASVGGTASASGDVLSIVDSSGFTLSFSVAGRAPQGTVAIAGTPQAQDDHAYVWTEADFELPAVVRPGEHWTVTVQSPNGTGAVTKTYTVQSSDDATDVAAGLAALIGGTGGFTADSSGGTLTVRKAAGFTSAISVAPAANHDVDPAPAAVSQAITINAPFQPTDVWRVTLSDAGGTIDTKTATGATREVVAQALAAAIDTVSGFRAV
ncbi:MAG TPA: hypothetical protein VF044_06140, partial [Actinomycetota bacterium]